MRKPPTPALALRFSALADPTRVRILHLLLPGEMCVCDLVEIIQVPQPTASRHLAYLRKTKLVRSEKRGLWMYYTLVPPTTVFHKALIRCVRAAATECPVLREDARRRIELTRTGGCC
jgi:ArsR family transcriptional regulator, arsenate/arsenite/antimonite-responsive transcriptional repressor